MINPYTYAQQGKSFDAWKGTLRHADLQGKDSPYLSGDEHSMVAAYMGEVGIPIAHWIVDNDPENAQAWWHDQLAGAQNWFREQNQEFSRGESEYIFAKNKEKEEALRAYNEALESEYLGNQEAQHQEYLELVDKLGGDYQAAIDTLASQQQAAAEAQKQAELQRQQQEYQSKIQNFQSVNPDLFNLSLDDDQYAGEQGQFQNYWAGVADQLSDAGYDPNSLLGQLSSEFETQLAQQGNIGTEYSSYLGDTRQANVDDLINQYGTASNYSQSLQSTLESYQNQYDQYNQQIQSTLQSLGEIYNSYQSLGDLDTAIGETAADKVAYVSGLRKGDFGNVDQYMTDFANQYSSKVEGLAQIYDMLGGEGAAEQIKNEYADKLTNMISGVQGAIGDYGTQYGTYAQDLLSRYGDVNQVTSGVFNQYAQKYQGDLQGRANNLYSLLGDTEASLGDLQSLIQTKAQESNQRQATQYEQFMTRKASQEANRKRAKSIERAGQQEQGIRSRTQGLLSSLFDDEEEETLDSSQNLTRGLFQSD